MFYIGFFKFESKDSKGLKYFGDFECVVDAKNIDRALEKFKRFLVKERKEGEFFDHPNISIFLDEVMEIKKEVKEAALIHHQLCIGERPEMGESLQLIENGKAGDIYDIRPAGLTPGEWEKSTEEEYFPEPFMVFK